MQENRQKRTTPTQQGQGKWEKIGRQKKKAYSKESMQENRQKRTGEKKRACRKEDRMQERRHNS